MQAHDDVPPSTRELVIAAAIRLFGENGFDSTSVRQIAQAAGGQNVALVSYYFGSKEGLRRACAEAVVARMRTALPDAPDDPAALSPGAARAALEGFCAAMLDFLTQQPEAQAVAAFVLRELARPGEVFDIVYAGLIEERHRNLCRLWAAATGADPDSPATSLAVFAAMGQVLYFRLGAPVVERRLGWDTIGPDEVRSIRETVIRHLRAILDAHRKAPT